MKTSTTPLESRLSAIIEAASFSEFDRISSDLWKAYGEGMLTDDEISSLLEQLAVRRTANRPLPTIGAAVGKLTFKRRPYQRSPDRARSIARRRLLAASGPLPPALAANFTPGEQAVLKIISDEVVLKGSCDLDIPQIAARAGVCVTIVRKAERAAELDGLIKIVRRPRPGQRNLTNIVTIIRDDWKVWLRRSRVVRRPSGNAAPLISSAMTGCKNIDATGTALPKKDKTGVWRPMGIGNRTGAGRA